MYVYVSNFANLKCLIFLFIHFKLLFLSLIREEKKNNAIVQNLFQASINNKNQPTETKWYGIFI